MDGGRSHAPVGLPPVLSPAQAANYLGISLKTLANWRCVGQGPPFAKVGGRVAYRLAGLISWVEQREIGGARGEGLSKLKITTRPYKKDPTRQHVDIMFPHPHKAHEMFRKRVVAPSGMDAAAAKAWGQKQAKDILRELFHQTAADKEGAKTKKDEPEVPEAPTVAEFWPTFVALYTSKLKRSSRDGYERIWELHLRPLLGELPLSAIDKATFARVKAACSKKGHSAAMINQVIAKLRHMMIVAAEQSLIEDDAIPKIRREDLPRHEVEVYSRDELVRLIAYAKTRGTENYILALLLVYGGLRIGEAAGLYWSDIDLRGGTMKICRNMMKGTMQDAPKGVVGTIALHPVLREALCYFHKGRTGERVLEVKDRAAAKRVRWWQGAIGAAVYGPHRIRHSVLTHMAMSGVDPYKLQAFARHSDLETTLRYYVHLNKAALTASAVAALDFTPAALSSPAKRTDFTPALHTSAQTPEWHPPGN